MGYDSKDGNHGSPMKTTFHNAHLFASDIDKTLHFYREMFGAEIIFDQEMAGARNVLILIGNGKINIYDQPPKDNARGPVHHLGIETDDLEALTEHMKSKGFQFKNPIKEFGTWKYVMAEAPDNVQLELFQIVDDGDSEKPFPGFSSLKQ